MFGDIGRIVIKNEIPRDLGLNFSKLQKLFKKILSELGDPALRNWVPWQLRIQGVQKEQKITYPQLCETEELHRYRRRRKHV